MARLEGKSSLGRLGLLIHSTAGFIDPGWDGHVTLELSNVANLPITIYPEMKIGQLSFVQMAEPTEQPYGSSGLGSKYQGQRGPDSEQVLAELRGDGMILVTGATGFVGGHVVRALAKAGEQVRALVRDARGAAALDDVECEIARGDVTDAASLRARGRGMHRGRSPRGDPRGQARRLRPRDDAGNGASARRRPERGGGALRPDERARHERGDEGHRPVLPGQMGKRGGRSRLGPEPRDLEAELRLRPRRRRAARNSPGSPSWHR